MVKFTIGNLWSIQKPLKKKKVKKVRKKPKDNLVEYANDKPSDNFLPNHRWAKDDLDSP